MTLRFLVPVKHEENQNSDVDVLVTFTETQVYLVMKEGIKPRLKEWIISEAVYD